MGSDHRADTPLRSAQWYSRDARPEKVADVRDLDMWLEVNGVRRQSGNTARMDFDPNLVVHYVSPFLVLEPGDLINPGTPPGVGMGVEPPIWLQPGEVLKRGVSGMGVQRQEVPVPR